MRNYGLSRTGDKLHIVPLGRHLSAACGVDIDCIADAPELDTEDIDKLICVWCRRAERRQDTRRIGRA